MWELRLYVKPYKFRLNLTETQKYQWKNIPVAAGISIIGL